jgi:hypothetical protein
MSKPKQEAKEQMERLPGFPGPSPDSLRRRKQVLQACELVQAAVAEAVEGLPAGAVVKLKEKVKGFTVEIAVRLAGED